MSQTVLYSTWRGRVGFVAVERVDGWKAYTGSVGGFNEEDDEREIAAHGAPLMEPEARALFPQLSDRRYVY